MLLAVNFHYVRQPGEYPHPGIHPVTPGQLERQLLELGRHFDFVGGQELLRAVSNGGALPQRACVVTFDDGLREQYLNALPVLERLRIPAVFFICTLPLQQAQALTVHKMHWLQATHGPEALLARAQQAAATVGLSLPLDRMDEAAAGRQYLYDDPATTRLKFLLNHVLPFAEYARLVAALFERETDEATFCRSWYMNEAQVADLARRQTVGSHAHAHCPLAPLAPAGQEAELCGSKTCLEALAGCPVEMLSYPYGGPTAVSREVAAAAQRAGYRAAFTMERSVNQSLEDPLLLARMATNDAPGGTSPLLTRDGDQWRTQPPLTAGRRTYYDEAAGATVGGGARGSF